MHLDLRLAGRHTAAFRCGCFFARGDGTGVAGWRLCRAHVCLHAMVAEAFGEARDECVIICPLEVERVPADADLGLAPGAEAEWLSSARSTTGPV